MDRLRKDVPYYLTIVRFKAHFCYSHHVGLGTLKTSEVYQVGVQPSLSLGARPVCSGQPSAGNLGGLFRSPRVN